MAIEKNTGKVVMEKLIYQSPKGPNERRKCVSANQDTVTINGTTHNALTRVIAPSHVGQYILDANSPYFDQEKRSLEIFAKRNGFYKIDAKDEGKPPKEYLLEMASREKPDPDELTKLREMVAAKDRELEELRGEEDLVSGSKIPPIA